MDLIIAAFLLFFAGCSASGCKNSQFEVEDRNTKNATCCDLCMQGFYMQEECTSMISTKCTKCPVGTFMDKWNYAHSCTKCQQPCHSGKVAFTNCSDTSDRTCRCPSGKYWNLGLVRCEVCTRCKEGQRIKSYCSEEHDSVCEECPSGTYAAGYKCLQCSRCQTGQTVIQDCTTAKDTICSNSHSRGWNASVHTLLANAVSTVSSSEPAPSGTVQFSSPVQHGTDISKESHTLLIVLGMVAVAVLIAVIVLVCFVWYCRRRKLDESKKYGSNGNETSTEDIEQSAVQVWVSQDVSGKEAPKSVVYKDHGLLWRDIDGTYAEELGSILNPDSLSNWSVLAGKLGFTQIAIKNFQLSPTKATQEMLSDWGTSNSATVFRLYSILKEMRRDDAAEVLKPLLDVPLHSEV